MKVSKWGQSFISGWTNHLNWTLFSSFRGGENLVPHIHGLQLLLTHTFTFTFMHLADAFILTYIAFKLQFYILAALAFPGNRTHDLGVASTMLYYLSYRKALHTPVNPVKKRFTHTCKSWRAVTLSVESSRREQNHERMGLRSWATTNEMLRCSIKRVKPRTPRSQPAERKPYTVKTASRNCNTNAQGKMMKHANIRWVHLFWIKFTWGKK